MTIEELDNKATYLSIDISNELKYSDDIVKLSIEFAISVLEEYKAQALKYDLWSNTFDDKIQGLKQYLDEI